MKKQSLLQSKLFQASIIVSLILISSAIFISQTEKLFGKAAGGITGNIILMDESPYSTSISVSNTYINYREYSQYYGSSSYTFYPRLPGTACAGDVTYCWINSGCSTTTLQDDGTAGDYRYKVSVTAPSGYLYYVALSFQC